MGRRGGVLVDGGREGEKTMKARKLKKLLGDTAVCRREEWPKNAYMVLRLAMVIGSMVWNVMMDKNRVCILPRR